MQMSKAAKIMVEILPGLKDAQMLRCWTAFEGCLQDKVPIAGMSAKVSGLFHVCGLFGAWFPAWAHHGAIDGPACAWQGTGSAPGRFSSGQI